MVQTWRADAGSNRDTDIIPDIVNRRRHWKCGDNIKNYLFIIYWRITLQDLQSVLRHVVYNSIVFTHIKKRISTILAIFLPIFDIFIHNLDTITGQENKNPMIFK